MLTKQTEIELSNEQVEEIVSWRRYLHQHPELSFQEYKTSAFLYETLSTFPNLEVTRPTETSVLAVLKGAYSGKVIGFRADMDALPIQEETGLPFASENEGVMHACGHDGHTAILLGVAKALSAKQEKIHGEIRFFFQHAEEQLPGGAREMVAAGVTEGVDYVFGLHLSSLTPVGQLTITPGAATSNSDMFHVTIKGKGGHSSQPENTIDPVVTSAQIITSLQTVVSRITSPKEELVVSVTTLQAGDAVNVIPEQVKIGASVRSFSQDVRKRAVEAIEQIIKGVSEANGCQYELNYTYGYDSVMNDTKATAIAVEAIRRKLGEGAYVESEAIMGGEDFSAFSNVIPGCFVFVGACSPENQTPAPHHHPKFLIDEAALADGANMFLAIAEDMVLE
ncbi:N-acyl-L-amino acid amidohydrolase [Terribacillus saccharophilus]|uniref:M20 metallopeptidase family protein n=1 Tax=Terribacillus saccharophilus TaxID=361277 RepID=UPI000BA60FBE|nr:amidohydrolase [Terribacillus saccharophilus]PAF21067.1 N-acyl-L-amino acid amidohydrolase [Terribacillus saccharophilus]